MQHVADSAVSSGAADTSSCSIRTKAAVPPLTNVSLESSKVPKGSRGLIAVSHARAVPDNPTETYQTVVSCGNHGACSPVGGVLASHPWGLLHCIQPCVVAPAYHPHTREVEAGGSEVQGRHILHTKFMASAELHETSFQK
jgi:hypothetical protein